MNVIPKVGQVWVKDANFVEVEITSKEGNVLTWDSVDRSHSGTIFDGIIHERFTFKPANDLEWLAVNSKECELTKDFGYVKRHGVAGINFHRSSDVCADSYTCKNVQSKRNELLGITEELEVKINNNIKIYPVNAGIVRANLAKMKELGAQLVESGVKMNIDDIAKEDGVTLRPVYTQAMSEAGELPPVGSECIFADADFDLYNGLSVGDKVEIIYHDINNKTPVAVFKHWDDGSFDVAMGGCVNFLPVDTRTDKEKLIDDIISIVLAPNLTPQAAADAMMIKFNITRKDES